MNKAHFSIPAHTEPLIQGDVLAFDQPGSSRRNYAFVLTADCDLLHHKFENQVTFVPILPAREYLTDVAAHEFVERFRLKLFKQVADMITRAGIVDGIVDADTISLTYARENWQAILNEFGLCAQKEAASIVARLAALKGANALAAIQKLSALENPKLPTKRFEQFIRDAFQAGRNGLFFLPNLPGVTELGFVIRLRHVQSVTVESAHRSRIDQGMLVGVHELSSRRIARFEDQLRFAITQQFASLFSRIGLPELFETEQDDTIDFLIGELSNE